MKKLLLFTIILALTATFGFSQSMSFEKLDIDYGQIEKGSEPLRVFKFTNKGTAPLIIQDAKGSCGCTVPSYPHEPIMPGQSNVVQVRYDTQRIGAFTKTVTLTTNDPTTPTITLTIHGEVKAPPAQETPINTGTN